MAESRGKPQASLLDRLYDDDPGTTRDVVPARIQDADRLAKRQMKESLHRDLEALLNSRVRDVLWDPSLERLNGSLLDYGLPDFTYVNLTGKAERDLFCGRLAAILRQHEPRLKNISVEPMDEHVPVDRTFRFRIHGLLMVDPVPEEIHFDSVVRPATGTVRVEGAEG